MTHDSAFTSTIIESLSKNYNGLVSLYLKLSIRKLNLTGSIEENKYVEEEQKPRKWYFHPMIGRVWYSVIYFCEYPKTQYRGPQYL